MDDLGKFDRIVTILELERTTGSAGQVVRKWNPVCKAYAYVRNDSGDAAVQENDMDRKEITVKIYRMAISTTGNMIELDGVRYNILSITDDDRLSNYIELTARQDIVKYAEG